MARRQGREGRCWQAEPEGSRWSQCRGGTVAVPARRGQSPRNQMSPRGSEEAQQRGLYRQGPSVLTAELGTGLGSPRLRARVSSRI